MSNRPSRYSHKIQIDMTPIMDLTFVLLIVFVITVPVLDYSTDVTPPSMTTNQKIEEINDASLVTLDAEGICKIDGIDAAFPQLEELFARLKTQQGKSRIFLRADKTRPYDDIITIMRAAKHAGLEISLMTQAE